MCWACKEEPGPARRLASKQAGPALPPWLSAAYHWPLQLMRPAMAILAAAAAELTTTPAM